MEEKKVTNKKSSARNNGKSTNSKNKNSSGRKQYNRNNGANKVNSSLKKSNNKVNNKENVDKIIDDIEMFEKTNSYDIVFDDNRLKDKESLDFSFVDGNGKKKKAKKEIEILEDVDYKEEAKKIEMEIINKKRNDSFSTGVIIVFSFILGFLICFIWTKESNYFVTTEKITEFVDKVVMDENYVFVGDSIFEGYKLDKHFEGISTVNSGVSGHKTTDILKNMNDRIYRYNPSKVILLIGTNDIGHLSSEETVSNIGKIIDGIKKNRKYAEIYVQSIYPINKVNEGWVSAGVRENDVIKSMNNEIKIVCNDKDVVFMDVYDLLADDDGNLKVNYSYDGLHLNENGYNVITKEINKVLK